MTLFAPDVPERSIARVLVANRGEIAVRIIRACRDLDIETVAVYADCDRDAGFVRMADAAYALGGNRPGETYLDMAKIMDIAARSGADAVHPGYGFLSENAGFAERVAAAGLVWIGPAPEVIARLGDKIEARRIALKVGAPLAAGSDGPVASGSDARALAEIFGLPVAIKAAHGGGGRGIKIARTLSEVEEAFAAATREAVAAFGRGECFVEQFLDRPRHVEVQVLADAHGTVKPLGTRDCSLQRRNQKLIEEAPAPFLDAATEEKLFAAARRICAEVGYVGAGTVEFLVSGSGVVSFLEVNTRLQVEHCVTEETTGIDIVCAMIRIAGGAKLANAEVPPPIGHAIEFRINAEDPARGFLPMPGTIARWTPPSGPGVRLDGGVSRGDTVSDHFDSLLAKVIVTGSTREHALARARRALREFEIAGVPTVLPFAKLAIVQPDFTAADGRFNVHTRWIETDFAATLAAAMQPARRGLVTPPRELVRFPVEIDGKLHDIGVPAELFEQRMRTRGEEIAAAADDEADVRAPMAGVLTRWMVEEGGPVAKGDVIAIMEAMKMELPVMAPGGGILTRIVTEQSSVVLDEPIARISS